MLPPVTKIVQITGDSTKKRPPKRQKFVRVSLRQWAILFSILIFIVTAVLTTCTVLGSLHAQKLLQLLQNDLKLEREKFHREIYKNEFTENEELLIHSQDVVLTFSKFLSFCMWLAWLNLSVSAVLIYGIATMTSIYIIPWILMSGTTYLLAMTTVIMAYLHLIPGLYINYTVLLVCIGASLVFIEMWYTIVMYYLSLRRTNCSRYTYSTAVIHAYGGYLHTIKPFTDSEKPMV